MGIDSHLSTCVGTQSPKYLEMTQGHISLSVTDAGSELYLMEQLYDYKMVENRSIVEQVMSFRH